MPYKSSEDKARHDRQYHQSYYQKNKDAILAKRKAYLQSDINYKKHASAMEAKRRRNLSQIDRVKLHYKCQNPGCGWGTSFKACDLDFHHLVPEDKVKSIAGMLQWSQARLVDEINKCVVLCAICHRRHHEEGLPLNERHLCRVDLVGKEILVETEGPAGTPDRHHPRSERTVRTGRP